MQKIIWEPILSFGVFCLLGSIVNKNNVIEIIRKSDNKNHFISVREITYVHEKFIIKCIIDTLLALYLRAQFAIGSGRMTDRNRLYEE